MSKNVLEKIINNWIEYYFPEWWGGSSDLDIGAVNALIDMKLWDYDSLFSVTNWLYQILNSIDTEDEIWLSSWDTRAEIVADDTSMSLISHCYAVMCYIANSTVAMSTILADASATNEISECWNSITIIAESQLASDLYLASVNWITSLFTYQTAQDAFFTSTARKTQIVTQNLMVIVNDDTLLAQLNTDSVVQACIVNSTTALSTIAWDNDKLEIVKENTAIMNAIAVNSTALAAMSDSDFFEYILEDSTYLTTCAWSTNWKAKINSYAADDLLDPIYFWTGDLGYSTFAALAADDTSMEIVQSNTEAMLIIESNDECSDYIVWKPWNDVVLYVPLEDDIAEKTWKNTITNYSVSLTTLNWVKCWYFNWSARIETSQRQFSNTSHTLSAWIYYPDSWFTGWCNALSSNPCWVYNWDIISITSSWTIVNYTVYTWNTSWEIKKSNLNLKWGWHNVVFSWWTLYLDWQVIWSNSWNYTWNQIYTIWWHTTNSSCTRSFMKWYLREVIIWNSVWNAQEVLKYYNKTKKYFWIS